MRAPIWPAACCACQQQPWSWYVQAVVEKLKHNYLRFAALQSQLLADLTSCAARPQEQSALKHFIGYTSQGKQYLDRVSQQRPFTNGKHKNGLHTTAAAPVSLFLRLLQQEVERLRRFVNSFAEDLCMRLLATADDLCMLRLTATKLETEAQQQECLLQHQELAAQCNCIGKCYLWTSIVCNLAWPRMTDLIDPARCVCSEVCRKHCCRCTSLLIQTS